MNETKISKEVMDVLRQVKITGNTLKLTCGDLSRDLYLGVNEVLERMGGKWNGRRKVHIFPYDPTPLYNSVIESGIAPEKNPLAYFPTPDSVLKVLEEILHTYDLERLSAILEPSAGTGAIADMIKNILPDAHLDVVEMNALNRNVLADKGFNLMDEGDFTKYVPENDKQYDLIVMNPPFAVDDDNTAFITHILLAYNMLVNGGRLVAIAPTGWLRNSSKKQKSFREFVFEYGEWSFLEDGAFKDSGTNVSTCIIELEKKDKMWKRTQKFDGYENHHVWATFLYINNVRTLHDSYEKILKLYAHKNKEQYFNATVREFIESQVLTEVNNSQNRMGVVLLDSDYEHIYETAMVNLKEYESYN